MAFTEFTADLGDRRGARCSDGAPPVGVACTRDGVAERLTG